MVKLEGQIGLREVLEDPSVVNQLEYPFQVNLFLQLIRNKMLRLEPVQQTYRKERTYYKYVGRYEHLEKISRVLKNRIRELQNHASE